MKLSMMIPAFAALFLINCSTHPEIKPYEELSLDDNISSEQELPYGQSIADSVFSDTSISSLDEETSVPTEFDDRIDAAESEVAVPVAPKKEVVSKKVLKTDRAPASAKGKNGFYTFSSDCVMKSEPNDASSNVGNVSKGKKLWLDSHAPTWFKAYKKSGTVYIPSSCVQ